MADISRLSRMVAGKQRGVDLTSNTLVVGSIKIGAGQTELTQTILDRLVTLQNGGTAGAGYVGILDTAAIYTATTVEAALAEVKVLADSTAAQSAALVTLSGVASLATHLGTFTGSTIPDSQTIKQALQALETYGEATRSIVNNFEWYNSAISIELDSDNIVGPSTGDRYLIAGTGLNDFASHDNAIAQWDGAAWVFTAPALGAYIAVDDENDGLYLYGGSSWTKKYFEATTASTGLTKVGFDIRIANAAANNGIVISSGAFSISLASGSGLKFVSNELAVDFAVAASLADLASTSNALGASLIGIEDTGAYFTGTTVEAALQELAADIAAVTPASVQESMIAGEAMASGTLFAVRMAKSGETAGRVYKAAKNASSNDNFHVVGLVYLASSASAGDAIMVYKMGKMDLGAAHGLTVGEEHFLGDAGAIIDGGAEGANAPTTASHAVVGVAIARSANVLEVSIHKYGVN